ncbi:MAG: thiolase family protein [Actinomycetota bacterium]|nr:thiolase family protein [Actinomycetota bacterium]
MSISGKTAIAGVGTTQFGKLPGSTAWGLQAEAVRLALEDAGLTKDDVDGLFTEPQFNEPLLLHGHVIGRMLGMKPNFLSTQSLGGATAIALIQHAAMAIEERLCEVAVCLFGETAKTGLPMLFGAPQMGRGQSDDIAFGVAGGAVMEARSAMRYMHEYNVTHEMLGSVAITFRDHASKNPAAQYQKPLTMEEYLGTPFVSEPFRRYDCAITSDGGVAVVVTSAERARDLRKPPAYITGIGQAHNLDGLRDPNHYTHFAGARSSERAFRMAGVRPEDVDAMQFYDCFTSTVLITLEDYGYCKKGEGGPFALEGNLGLGKALPSNTSGGSLSEADLAGWNQIAEGVRQVRNECDERQVPNAQTVVVAGHGGFQASHATLVISKDQP